MINKALQKRDDLAHCISTTTRPPRQGEKDGVNYHFIERGEFERQIEEGMFLEYAKVLNNYYGTSLAELDRIAKEGKMAVLDIDVQGAIQMMEMRAHKNLPSMITIFVEPPSLEILEERLRIRGSESEEQINERVALAKEELLEKGKYDLVIVNDTLEAALKKLEAAIENFIAEP